VGFNVMLKKLKGNRTQQRFAMILNYDQTTLSRKLSGKSNVTVEEAIRIVEKIGLPLNIVCEHCEVKKHQRINSKTA
jgi:plasmid maintenance system antidote protein VapI